VSVVEDVEKRREPLPLAAVYFISPTPVSIQHLVADFESKPLYPSVHVFFSSGVTQDAVDKIKRCRVRAVVLTLSGASGKVAKHCGLHGCVGGRCGSSSGACSP
jgi:hypothetical protein